MPVSHAEVMRTLTPAQRRRVKARAKVLIGEETAARYGTLAMLRRIAEALNKRVEIRFVLMRRQEAARV
jgi:hypothetical protein